jgi:hypothetical protein
MFLNENSHINCLVNKKGWHERGWTAVFKKSVEA